MPIANARKKARKADLERLRGAYGLKFQQALLFLQHPDADERQELLDLVGEYDDINTYREAVDYLTAWKNDPGNQLLCETCGWLNKHVCPECSPGCGCVRDCSGWRHHEMAYDEPDDEYDDPDRNIYCTECGAGSSGPYDECTCHYEDDEQDGAPDGEYDKNPPRDDPEPPDNDTVQAPVPVTGGWGSAPSPYGDAWPLSR